MELYEPENQNEIITETTEPYEDKFSWGGFLLETAQTIVLAIILYFLIDTVVARVRVENISMLPTLEPGEYLLVNKLSYKIGEFEHGDIVVFHNPRNPIEDFIKRVIGTPGDEIIAGDGEISVNGHVLEEGYISAPVSYQGEWVVPEGELFVLGDNRNQSSDSHSWGYVPVENIVGKAMVIYWPFEDIKVLTHPQVVNAAN